MTDRLFRNAITARLFVSEAAVGTAEYSVLLGLIGAIALAAIGLMGLRMAGSCASIEKQLTTRSIVSFDLGPSTATGPQGGISVSSQDSTAF